MDKEVTKYDLKVTGTIHIPHRVPIGFHGNWIPDSELEEQRKLQG